MKRSIVTSYAKSVQICQTTEEMKRFMMLLVIMMLIENCQTTKKDHKIEADNDDFGNYYENFSDNWRDHETDAGGLQQEVERVGTDQGGQA